MDNNEKFKTWLNNGDISEESYKFLSGIQMESEDWVNDCKEKKISITISTHNRPYALIRLIESIKMQRYSNYEIIIIDDKSTDNTAIEINKYINDNSQLDIQYHINEENLGVSESKKRGYNLCTGDIIIFSDDDDYFIDSSYFAKVNKIYNEHQDCTMTTASTLYHYEKNDTYSLNKLNFNVPLENNIYFKGFAIEYIKPGSMFTLTLNAERMKEIEYNNLICFNDMSLYLYAALAKGKIYSIVEAVGVYSVQIFSMTSGVSSIYTVNNLDAKIDIGNKAVECGILNIREQKKWNYQQCLPTLLNFFNGNIKNSKEIVCVNVWMMKKLQIPYNLLAFAQEIKARFLYYCLKVLK